MNILSDLLVLEGFTVIKTSNKKNKILRLLDMIKCVCINRNKVDYILIDVFSTASFYYTVVISRICNLLKIKYITILRGGNLPSRIDMSPKLSKNIFKKSLHNVAPSKYLQFEFNKRGYKTILIPNVLDLKKYKFKQRDIIHPKLLYVRAFAKIYNPLMSVMVLEKLMQIYPNTKLCMVGPDKDGTMKEVQNYIKNKKLEKNIEITGVLTKEEWHKKSEEFDIFINTTNFDNTPVSVMEAMALGLAVVSTNVGGIPFLLEDENDALLVNPKDIDKMVFQICRILNNKLNHLQLNARKKVESFSWEENRNKWLEILK